MSTFNTTFTVTSCFPIIEEDMLDPFFGYIIEPEEFAKLATFIISASKEHLDEILYATSTSEMATMLSRTSLEANRYIPAKKFITKCKWALGFLRTQPGYDKKVVIPLALMYLTKYRLNTNDDLPQTMPQVWLAVALKLANTIESDFRTNGLKLSEWATILFTDLDDMREAQHQLLTTINYTLVVKEPQLDDFIGRMQRVFRALESAE